MAAKIVSLQCFFFGAPIFRSRLEARSKKNSSTTPVSTKCRLLIGYKMQTVGWVQIADWEFILIFAGYVLINMSSYNLPSVTQLLFRHHLSRLFALLWNIPCPFLDLIILNIISSFHIVFSLCARVGWCDVCTDFTDLIKVDIDVNEMSLLNI